MKQILKGTVVSLLTLSLMIIGVLVMAVGSAFATKMLHRNAQELTQLADRVFVAVCVEAVEETAPIGNATMSYTRYVFDVLEPIKGSLGQTVTIKQLGRMRGPGSIVAMPVYQEGAKYLLFMLPESQIGLSSPVGLFQGSFKVFEGTAKGRMQIINGIGNRGLFKDMTASNIKNVQKFNQKDLQLLSIKKGPIEYSRFIDFVKKMVE